MPLGYLRTKIQFPLFLSSLKGFPQVCALESLLWKRCGIGLVNSLLISLKVESYRQAQRHIQIGSW